MSISTNVSSIQANQGFLNATAKSIANQSGDLSRDIPNLIIAQNTNAVNVTAIKAQNELLGSLLDIKS